MAQTTDHITLRNVKAEISTDGTTWTDISGTFNSLTNSGGEVITGEAYTADGELPLVGIGKKGLTETTLKVVYTETAGDAWRKFFDAYKNGSDIYFRYSPKGGSTGDLRFTSGKGFVTTPAYPGGEVSEGTPQMVELKLKHPGFTDAAVS